MSSSLVDIMQGLISREYGVPGKAPQNVPWCISCCLPIGPSWIPKILVDATLVRMESCGSKIGVRTIGVSDRLPERLYQTAKKIN